MSISIKKTIYITPEQDRRLKLIKSLSLKSEGVLIREAIELLFRTPPMDKQSL